MGTFAQVLERGGDVQTVRDIVRGAFAEVEFLLNVHDPSSQINSLANLSDDQVLKFADRIVRPCYAAAFTMRDESAGVFNPRWKGLKTLDLGAIAKGYAVEMAAQMLEEKGISGYVINVGGNVRTVGTKADGSAWVVGIENPDDDGSQPYLAYLHLAGESIVTSGSYQRYYTVEGKAYHHIIDPETLMPAEYYRSVSVICKNSADGDALSTALFCMSLEEGMSLIQNFDGVEAMWVFPDGEKRYSEGFEDYFVPR